MLVFVNITEIDRPEYPLSTGGVWSDRCVGHVTSETVLNVSSWVEGPVGTRVRVDVRISSGR